jgi:hypothetical protein
MSHYFKGRRNSEILSKRWQNETYGAAADLGATRVM